MMKPKVRHKQTSQIRCKGNHFALWVMMATILTIAGCAGDRLLKDAPLKVVGEPERVGELVNPQLKEVSGLSASSLYPGLLWAINDGGRRRWCESNWKQRQQNQS